MRSLTTAEHVAAGLRVCWRCRKAKPTDQFWRSSRHADGIGTKCKACGNSDLRRWRASNPAKQKAIQRRQCARLKADGHTRQKARYLRLKTDVVSQYGGRCYCCGEGQIDFLTLDHALNDGAADRRSKSRNMYESLAKAIRTGQKRSDIRVACYNCNLGRQFAGKGGECPHTAMAVG